MSEAAAGSESGGQRSNGRSLFSARLDAFLESLDAGETPNAGRFCAFCYNPLPLGFERCDHCGQDLQERPPITSLPDAILTMYQRKQRRESVVVNSFAYLGLALGMTLFLVLVAVNVLLLNKALWFFLFAMVVFLVGSRLLAGICGGVIGDEIGYRYANRHLAEDWAAHVAQRETQRGS